MHSELIDICLDASTKAAVRRRNKATDGSLSLQNCDWEAHPAECIMAHTLTNKVLDRVGAVHSSWTCDARTMQLLMVYS